MDRTINQNMKQAEFLQQKIRDLYRLKGITAIAGEERRYHAYIDYKIRMNREKLGKIENAIEQQKTLMNHQRSKL